MKHTLRISLLALGLFTVTALPAHAVTSFSENFSAGTLKASRWSLTKDGGKLAPANGKLNYSVSKAGKDSSSHILLRGIQPKYNESWEVIVHAVNAARVNSWTWIGVAVVNSADMDDFVGLEISSGKNITEISNNFETNGVEAAKVEKKISSTSASLRVTFSSVTKTLTLWYRTSSADAWSKHATFSTNNSKGANRRGNWNMNNKSGKFTLALYGGSEGAKVPAGKMSLDNFVIRNLK